MLDFLHDFTATEISLDGIISGGAVSRSFKVLIPVEERQFAETVRFYSEVFDVSDPEIGESDLGNPWCRLNVSGTTVMIHAARGGQFPYPEFRPTGHGIALEIQVGDLARTLERLKAMRREALNRWEYSEGGHAASVEDPVGNVLEIWEDAV